MPVPVRPLLAMLALSAVAALAPAPDGRTEMLPVKTATRESIELPAPRTRGRMTLEEALAARRSAREFRARSLTSEELSQLLWAAQGATARDGRRTAPSAGALFPLELYVALESGLWHYVPASHRLERRSDRDPRPALRRAALGQAPAGEAPAVFVLTAVTARTAARYHDRAERYVQLEAGHAAQNLLLEATALGLGGVPMGAFDDAGVRDALSLAPGERALYLLPVGEPR